ncbi:MAG: translocation protein TolB [Imperialibacter sp.]|uniref:translocation protein TolB n=1 Tax=Imperialibacter sp. TaxID=2038411 RepID=UPI0032EB766E
MMNRQLERYWKIGLLISFILFCSDLSAQNISGGFGKNRVQYKNFEWFFYSAENFDIYFYQGGEDYAKAAAEFLEVEFDKLTDILGYAPYAKTKIFLYNSVADLQQSNIGVNDETFAVGGKTNFIKLQVEVAYPGTMLGFKEELLHQISRMLIKDMMFGGSLTDMFQNTYLLSLPEWFIEGAAMYVTNGWSIEMDDFMRDFQQKNGRFKKLNKYSYDQAGLIGQSIWNYIVVKYGRSNISNILNLTRIIRNEENSIASTLGVPFKTFLSDWQNYYLNANTTIEGEYRSPEEDSFITHRKKDKDFTTVSISPDGKHLSYVINDNGKYRVFVKNLETGKSTRVMTGGYRMINQDVDLKVPMLNWVDNVTLGIVDVKYGLYEYVQYDILGKSLIRRPLERFSQVHNIAFNGNGKLAVISGDINGQNDLYLVSLTRNALRRLTNDVWDDITPSFLPGTDAIVFSSNRPTDSLKSASKTLKDLPSHYNLFLYDLDTTKNVVVRLTNNISSNYLPKPLDTYNILYLSDQKGIINLYRYNREDSIYSQVSNFNTSIKSYDVDPASKTLTAIMLNDGVDKIYKSEGFDYRSPTFTRQTLRQDVQQARFLTQRLGERKAAQQQIVDSVKTEKAEQIQKEAEKKSVLNDPALAGIPDLIDTENYQFDNDVIKQRSESSSFLSNFRGVERKSKILGPVPYEPRFSANNVTTSFVIDPLRKFGMLLETRMNDMTEDHHFYGGALAIANLRQGDIFGEYQFLKYRVDFKMRYDRKVIRRESNGNNQLEAANQKYVMNTYTVGASLPLSVYTRIAFQPFFSTTRFLELDYRTLSTSPPSFPTDISTSYAGFKSEIVFDNTISHGTNIIEGTRAKVAFNLSQNLGSTAQSFNNIEVDVRHYQKIYRELIFATRFMYGRFFGNDAKTYVLGGMDNWLFNRTDTTGQRDPILPMYGVDNSDILFLRYVTNLRGFNYNKLNGNNVLLFNAELRFPVVRFFHRGPISSNFLRNLQFTSFYDLGSAWTGASPFNENNNVNTITYKVPGSPFQAVIRNSKSAWLASYGFGVRTYLLGYYIKLDMAYPIEDYEVQKRRFYLTLGFDF